MRGFFLTVLATLSPVTAQTFVVDINNGPGTNFVSLSAAIATVPDGATLIVRAGDYADFDIDGKGLTLLAEPGVAVLNLGQIRNTSPAQAVVLSGVGMTASSLGGWQITNCQGYVHIEAVLDQRPTINPSLLHSFTVTDSAQVLFRACVLWHAKFSNSAVVVESCNVSGGWPYCASLQCTYAYPALELTGGQTQVMQSSLRGGRGQPSVAGYPLRLNKPSIQASNADVRVFPSAILETWSVPGVPDARAIDGTGTLRIHPGATLTTAASPAIGPAIASQFVEMPRLRLLYTSVSPGGTIVAEALASVGDLALLLAGLPGPPLTVPGIVDPVWIDPAVFAVAGVGTIGTSGPAMSVAGSIAVPNQPGMLGTRIGWQCVAWNGTSLEASNPTAALVR